MTGEASAHAQHKFEAVKADFVAYNKLTTGLRHDLGIFARISKFRCFHETRQTQNEFERFFLQLGRICFRILLRQSENFSGFSQHDKTLVHVIQRARVQAPLHQPHKFFDVKSFYKILPLLLIVIAKSR